MGLLLFLFLSLNVFAADCTEADAPFPILCDNLYINNPLNLSAQPGPIVINVTGVVEIRANVTFDGLPGVTTGVSGTTPANAGPSGTRGGGLDGTSAPEDGQDGVTANGKAPPADGTCGNGGSGGGLFSAGDNGGVCATSGAVAANGGGIAPGAEFDFGANFRGGYGGGAGGIVAAAIGTGGGGGGAIHIIAGGNVTIFSGVTISARGGRGGDAATVDGAGGGGSGGALWIQSTAGIISNSGTIDLRGGDGGNNPNNLNDGGNGGNGVYQFEDLNGTSNGSGLVLPGAAASSRSSLKSDISCGTIAKPNDNKNVYQMMMGFFLIMILSMFSKTLSLLRTKI